MNLAIFFGATAFAIASAAMTYIKIRDLFPATSGKSRLDAVFEIGWWVLLCATSTYYAADAAIALFG